MKLNKRGCDLHGIDILRDGKKIRHFEILVHYTNRKEKAETRYKSTALDRARIKLIGGDDVLWGRFRALTKFVGDQLLINIDTNEYIITDQGLISGREFFEVEYQNQHTGRCLRRSFQTSRQKGTNMYWLTALRDEADIAVKSEYSPNKLSAIHKGMSAYLYAKTGLKAPRKTTKKEVRESLNFLQRLAAE